MRTPATAALTLAAIGLAVTGCTEGSSGTEPTPEATASTTATASASPVAGGPVASCVTGDWRSTGASGEASAGGASATVSGGDGVAFTVGANGETTVDFTGMQPATFAVAVAGVDVRGTFGYAGSVAATVRTGGGTDATAGTWEPVGAVDWADTRVTVELTEPVRVTPLDNARIGDYVGDSANQTGNVVDVDPLLGVGRYECRGDTLVLTPNDNGITWTLARA